MPKRFFSATSIWNKPLPATAELDPNSGTMMAAFNEEVAREAPSKQLNINTTAWSIPLYTVPASQPTVKVRLNKPNTTLKPLVYLQSAWEAVPLPSNAQPAKGTDKSLAVWQPSTNKMWEFYAFENTLSGPVAQWGGAMEKVSSNQGFYDSSAWLNAQTTWGGTASSLPIVGGLMTLEDLAAGHIEHALAIAVPNVRAKTYAYPAQRTDGTSTSPLSLPEGAHMRLDPHLDIPSLKLPHVVAEMAEAAQRYGIVVADKASNIVFYGQDPTPTGTEPYLGPTGYWEGSYPYKLLQSFPWSHLQLLKMRLQRPR